MPDCSICGEKIPAGSRTCAICGSSSDEFFPTVTGLQSEQPAATPPSELPTGSRYCPVCAKVYGPEYTDAFCSCGTEFVSSLPMAPILEDEPFAPFDGELPPMAPILEDVPLVPLYEEPITEPKTPCVKPASGTPCLVLYGNDKTPLQYFALDKDAMLIGRLDAVAGNFPDIDLDEWFDRATIRKISRQHALILRNRTAGTFALRPLTGNTGTQLESQMLQAMQEYPLRPGHRIILGGAIRLKFEIA